MPWQVSGRPGLPAFVASTTSAATTATGDSTTGSLSGGGASAKAPGVSGANSIMPLAPATTPPITKASTAPIFRPRLQDELE